MLKSHLPRSFGTAPSLAASETVPRARRSGRWCPFRAALAVSPSSAATSPYESPSTATRTTRVESTPTRRPARDVAVPGWPGAPLRRGPTRSRARARCIGAQLVYGRGKKIGRCLEARYRAPLRQRELVAKKLIALKADLDEPRRQAEVHSELSNREVKAKVYLPAIEDAISFVPN